MGDAFVELRRRGRCMGFAAALLASTSIARAADEPVGTTADTVFQQNQPPPPPGQPPVDQAPPAVEEPMRPQPQGPLIAAGVAVYPDGGAVGYRLDFGPTISSSDKVDLRLLAVITFSNAEAAGITTYGLSPFLTLQYVRSFVQKPSGRFALIVEGGAGPTFAWIEFPDLPFMPSHTDFEVRPAGRLAAAAEYRSSGGFFAALQPAGVVMAIVDGNVKAAFELGARLGYQW